MFNIKYLEVCPVCGSNDIIEYIDDCEETYSYGDDRMKKCVRCGTIDSLEAFETFIEE